MLMDINAQSPRHSVATHLLAACLLSFSTSALACNNALEIKAGAEVPSELKTITKQIAAKFCDQQVKLKRPADRQKVVITDGRRETGRQARYIAACMKQSNKCSHYENQEAIKELKKVWEDTADAKRLAALKRKIDDQVSRKCFLSKHLSSRALDLRRFDHATKANCSALKADDKRLYDIIRSYKYKARGSDGKERKYSAKVILCEGSKADHFHLNFEPLGFDPKKCPKG